MRSIHEAFDRGHLRDQAALVLRGGRVVRSSVEQLRHRAVPLGQPAHRSVAERLGSIVIRKA